MSWSPTWTSHITTPPTHTKEGGSPPFKFKPTGWTSTRMSLEHILGHFWLAAKCAQFSPNPQMSERRSGTICAIVERPDHHCEHDLVHYCRSMPPHNSSQLAPDWIYHGRIQSRTIKFITHIYVINLIVLLCIPPRDIFYQVRVVNCCEGA